MAGRRVTLQMTPIAPSNTNAYRCFHSSVMYPADRTVVLTTARRTRNDPILLSYDGLQTIYPQVDRVEIRRSDRTVRLIRFEEYDYWKKLTDKLL